MKSTPFFPLLVVALAHAQPAVVEPHLTPEDKARLSGVMEGALRENSITQAQYEQSVSWLNSVPCDGVDRSLTRERKTRLEAAIALQQKRQKVEVYGSFELSGWYVIYSNASVGDEPYMFYTQDPTGGVAPVAVWSGAATIFETSEVAQWVKENSNGIPSSLADCFAWHVTLSPAD